MDILDDRESLMVSRLEVLLNRPLNDEDKFNVEQWDRGRVLAQVIHTDAWTILMDTIKLDIDKATQELLDLPPGHKDVPTAHAAVSALVDFYRKFQQDIEGAITASMTTPAIVKEAARGRSGVPPESM
jgi:hypothetical protein